METPTFKVRDRRNKGWFYLDNQYLDGYGKVFGAVGSVVYLSLCRHADNEQKCFPSEKYIAKEFGLTDRTVRTYLKYLENGGIIRIDRKIRNKQGKWRHNVYWLLDKSEWKSPEEIISDGNGRKIRTSPEVNRDPLQRKQFPSKDTNMDNTHRNDTHNAKQGFAIIDDLIGKFADVNPNYQNLHRNVTQRKAAERLIQQLGIERILEIVEELPQAIKEKYCPVVTTPLELEKKLPQLLIYLEKRKTKTHRTVDSYY